MHKVIFASWIATFIPLASQIVWKYEAKSNHLYVNKYAHYVQSPQPLHVITSAVFNPSLPGPHPHMRAGTVQSISNIYKVNKTVKKKYVSISQRLFLRSRNV